MGAVIVGCLLIGGAAVLAVAILVRDHRERRQARARADGWNPIDVAVILERERRAELDRVDDKHAARGDFAADWPTVERPSPIPRQRPPLTRPYMTNRPDREPRDEPEPARRRTLQHS